MTAAHSPERYSSVRDLMKTNVPTISSQADLFEDGLRILQQSGLGALPVTENGELVGMLTIEDVGQASLLRPLPATEEVSRIDDRAISQKTASR
jgi:CBS domain-containing protein